MVPFLCARANIRAHALISNENREKVRAHSIEDSFISFKNSQTALIDKNGHVMKVTTTVAIAVVLAIALLIGFFIGQHMQNPAPDQISSETEPTELEPTTPEPTETEPQTTEPEPTESPTPTPTNIEEVVIEKVSLECWGRLDSMRIYLTLNSSAEYSKSIYYEVLVEDKDEKFEGSHYLWLGNTFLVGEVTRNPGEYNYNFKVRITDENGEVLATEDCTASISTMKVGDTIAEVETYHNLSLTLTSWIENKIAVDGPYMTGYYTFTARPGMKFIILFFRFQNNWIREQSTPYINSGELFTDAGYIYERWDSPGAHSEEYSSREATQEEVRELIGDAGAFENLLQEESVEGCVIFEIPEEAEPLEAKIAYMPNIVVFN